MTDHSEFKKMNPSSFSKEMGNLNVFDARNVINLENGKLMVTIFKS
jgi:UDP-N-acetyl-D-mannosaminuronate dehydrogenase